MVKRMLSRSRTESFIDNNAGHNVRSVTPSSNTLPVYSSPPKIVPSRSPSPTQSKPILTKHTRTYAGASRSYRIALPAADLAEPDDTRESYADLRSRWGVDNSEDDPRLFDNDTRTLKRTASVGSRVLANGMMNDLKSITELRSKGESRRFLDEVGYLFEGIEGGCAIALRRASVLEIVTKLCDPEFNRRAKTSDFYARAWDVFLKARRDGPDKILDATLSFFVFLSTRDPQTLSELAHNPELVPTLLDILRSLTPTSDVKGDGLNQGLKKDILALALSGVDAAGLRASGIVRTDVVPLKALADVIAKSGVMKDIRGLSTRTLLSTTLSSLPHSLLPPAFLTLPSILNSLRAELLLVPSRVSAWERGLELFPGYTSGIGLGRNGNPARNGKGKETQKLSDPLIEIATPSLAHIHACLRVVDAYLLEEWTGNVPSRSGVASDGSHGTREQLEIHRALADPSLTDELMELCVATEILVRDCVRNLDTMDKEEDAEEGLGELARKTLFSTLRILTLLPSSTSSHSRPSPSYSRSSPTYSDSLHDSWAPSDSALSLVTRVILRAQAGWVGSLGGDGVKGKRDDEATQGNQQHAVKPEQLEETNTSSSPTRGSQQESKRSPRKRTPLPVPSPSKLAYKSLSQTNASSKLGRQGTSYRNGTPSKGTSTPSEGNDVGKGKSKAISVPPYTLTRVESFDLLCLALGLLLNWASEGIEGGGMIEGMERILLNRACSSTRGCSHICSCPPSSQVPLLSCLVSVYQAYSSSVSVSTDSSSRKPIFLSGHERKPTLGTGRKPPSARQKQHSPSASPSFPSTSPSCKTASPQPTVNISSMPHSPELTFLAGYTAVLLGLLCTPTAPRRIRVLPTNRSLIFGDILIETLIRDVRDFLALYDDLEGEFRDEDNNVDVDVSLDTDRGRSEGRGESGGRGRGKALEKRSEDVARGVLRMLETLRDDGL